MQIPTKINSLDGFDLSFTDSPLAVAVGFSISLTLQLLGGPQGY